MKFDEVITLYDISSVITVVLVIIGGIFSLIQWRKTVKQRKSEFIYELISKIRIDENIVNTLVRIDYGEKWYENFHDNKKLEFEVDKTFAYFSYICYLKKCKLIDEQEFYFFEYHLTRIFQDEQSIAYLYNIYHFAKKIGTNSAHYYLIEYGKEKGLIGENFELENQNFPHYLNY